MRCATAHVHVRNGGNCAAGNNGAPERSRTSDLLVRSQTLYPAELRARRNADALATVYDTLGVTSTFDCGCSGGRRAELADDVVWPHHFIVLVLEDVAMPDVAELLSGRRLRSLGKIELLNHSREVTGIGFDRVLPGWTLV
jgi:hypothetical protein